MGAAPRKVEQENKLERNVTLAVVLSLLVLVTYNSFVTRYVERPSAPKNMQTIKEKKQDKKREIERKPEKMSPTAMDPKQTKMMQFLPLLFTFMFLNFPSGLVLYWLVNNLLQIGQQYVIQKKT